MRYRRHDQNIHVIFIPMNSHFPPLRTKKYLTLSPKRTLIETDFDDGAFVKKVDVMYWEQKLKRATAYLL